MSEFLSPLVYQLGTGGVLGFVVGYAIKKMIKIVIVVMGAFAALLIYLEYKGIINVNYDKFASLVGSASGLSGKASQWLLPIVAHLPFAGSFAVGAALGFKMG